MYPKISIFLQNETEQLGEFFFFFALYYSNCNKPRTQEYNLTLRFQSLFSFLYLLSKFLFSFSFCFRFLWRASELSSRLNINSSTLKGSKQIRDKRYIKDVKQTRILRLSRWVFRNIPLLIQSLFHPMVKSPFHLFEVNSFVVVFVSFCFSKIQ